MIRRSWRLAHWRSPWRTIRHDGYIYRFHELALMAPLDLGPLVLHDDRIDVDLDFRAAMTWAAITPPLVKPT